MVTKTQFRSHLMKMKMGWIFDSHLLIQKFKKFQKEYEIDKGNLTS